MRRAAQAISKFLIRAVAIFVGLWGGWRAAGALNDRRIDIPRPVPTTRPINQNQ